jgi:hypothetical protein
MRSRSTERAPLYLPQKFGGKNGEGNAVLKKEHFPLTRIRLQNKVLSVDRQADPILAQGAPS